MRIVRPILLATLLLAPLSVSFAQSPLPTKAAPTASAKATAAPTASAKVTAVPVASIPPPAGPGASASHEISTEVDAAMNEKAQALFKEGNTFFRDGKYAQAQAAYKAAWALDLRNQRIVRNLGSTELELKMYRDAAEHLTIALRLAAANDPKRAGIQKDIAEARAKVGAIVLKVKGAGQDLDGVEVVHMETGRSYQTPLVDPIFVDAGKAGFRIRREGYESQEKVFELKPGEETSADVALERAPGFDGKTAGPAPTGVPTTTPGGERSKLPGFIAGGVGLAAAIAGGVLVGVGFASASDIDSKLPRGADDRSLCLRTAQPGEAPICPDLRSQAESASALANAGLGLLIGGAVVAAGAAVYLLIPSKKAGTAAPKLVPVVGQSGGGLVLTGSF
jgi:tetratricopeptide (TPR) repeat protein